MGPPLPKKVAMRLFTPKARENYRALHTVYLLSGPSAVSPAKEERRKTGLERMQDPVGELPPANQAAPLTPAALGFCAALVGELGAHVYERIVQLCHITAESFFLKGRRYGRPTAANHLVNTIHPVWS